MTEEPKSNLNDGGVNPPRNSQGLAPSHPQPQTPQPQTGESEAKPAGEKIDTDDGKPELQIVDDSAAATKKPDETEDEDEREFRAQRRALPDVHGSSAAGIVAINVSKLPAGKNEFFRTHPEFSPIVDLVVTDVGMETQYFTATDEMNAALESIGIKMAPHTLYLTVSETGAIRIVPIRCPDEDGTQNEYNRTKEVGILRGRREWVRIYTDTNNKMYKNFPAPKGRFSDPVWPALKHAKIFRLGFKEKGNRIDSHQHQLFMKWAGRANDKK
jgi:hypothetical protein